MSDWTNYIASGYSPNDGLGEGRWVPVPGSAGIQRWVGDLEPPVGLSRRDRRRGQCIECQAPIDMRSTRCRSCHGRGWDERRWADAS